MDQFRQVGKVLGGIQALMVLKFDISINQRQCSLLLDMFNLAFETISEEIKQNLRLEENHIKWKSLENPLKELHRIFKEGEIYIRNCLDVKDWWGKAISLHQSRDCVEFHIHNLLWCFVIVIEAIESAGEISGVDQDDMQKRRLMLTRKYDQEWNDPKIFQWKYSKQYLVSREFCSYLATAWKEDRGILLEKVKISTPYIMAKHERKLADFFSKKIEGIYLTKGKLLPAWILLGAKDYNVKRRLGSMGSNHKEIFWLGESFALRSFFGEITEQIQNEISVLFSLSHPNVVQYLCGFYDEARKEGFLVIELMNDCLANYVRDNPGQRKKSSFSLTVAVDIMLQVARGMEYLHSKRIYHGDLISSNILLKSRNLTNEVHFYAKITGFGLTSIKSYSSKNKPNQTENDFIVWHAPEVISPNGTYCTSKFTEKADIYSFGMLCFEILTGKTPFQETHLQGDKMTRNIKVGERPLFPHSSPKFIVNLIKRCWQEDPFQRPSFSSICRILRYIKKSLVINPDNGQVDSPPPLVDYCEIENGYSKSFPYEDLPDLAPVSQIPFQMFCYKLVEREKITIGCSVKPWDLAIETEGGYFWGELAVDQRSVYSEVQERRRMSKIGCDQRSVCSESPVHKGSPKRLTRQISTISDSLLRKKDLSVWSRLTGDQKSVGFEIEEKKTVREDDGSDGSDTNVEKKVMFSATSDQVSGPSETQEQKLLAKNQETSKIVFKQNIGCHVMQGSKFIAKDAPGLVKSKSDSYSRKTRVRKSILPPIASDDSELGSASPDHAEEKKVSKTNDQKSRHKKSLVKAKSLAAKISNCPGRGLSPISSEKRSSPRLSPARRSFSKSLVADRSHKIRRENKILPWI